jgi:hypothetical protein
LASNPRLVKEADALHSAGYQVHVVCGSYFPPLYSFDHQIRSASPWEVTTVSYPRNWTNFPARILQQLARRRVARHERPAVALALSALHRAHGALTEAARRIPARLFVGHTVTGLGVAALAARFRGVPFAFDAEDFHSAETVASESDPAESASVAAIESELVPHAAYVTASSPLIAEAYAERYHVPTPCVVLNVFPLRDAPIVPYTPDVSPNGTRRLYWFSQTTGRGRGLEQIVGVLACMRTRCSLHLRGIPSPGFPSQLRATACASGYEGEIEFLPTGPAGEMVRLAAPYDLGLCLEQRSPRNRDLCLTNKVFTFLLAGLPIACTPTQAQAALVSELGDAALLLDPAKPEKAAAALDRFFSDNIRPTAARSAAWKAGHERFSWDLEQARVLQLTETVLKRTAATTQ